MNKAILMGRLTKDPELKEVSNDIKICNFTLAVNRKFAKEGAQKADFINIVAFKQLAEFCSKWFQKGRQVAVVGRIQTRTYDNKEGQKIYITEIVADEAFFADSKPTGQTAGDAQEPQTKDGFYPLVADEELPF